MLSAAARVATADRVPQLTRAEARVDTRVILRSWTLVRQGSNSRVVNGARGRGCFERCVFPKTGKE